ncbi:single-stranded-DNA-specific exonuclease RecJ [Rhodovibrio salinarum]|uniref:Single-stranded-DNA-specific exonuclease RecJ n=1 Tax=Rhodovibrio salinarum TaxID=1087 RepID=A0A934V183_9PROT|nr:single-stranded-DNA-specific exonuclease RecJ [Rhodovibrio salinarum]MBK1697904.1 single-stranded-DNA-specific exonuclease RecJ [Rhodovibrio salinarum]
MAPSSSAAAETEAGRPGFLGVERSLSGKRWEARLSEDRLARLLAQRLNLPEVVGRVMAGRGVTLEAAEGYLNPSLKTDLPNPDRFQDMRPAAERIADAVQDGEPIAVLADYDVDGATSAALLRRFLQALGHDCRIYIPDRIEEGYGPNPGAFDTLAGEGYQLVVTLDCGTTSYSALDHAAQEGQEVVVVDHHTAEPQLPACYALVNPNRLDDESGCGQLAAVGVTFMLTVAVNRTLRARGYYGEAVREPDLRRWLDLVALGTVCDVVPLTGVNRALVTSGLKVLQQRRNVGLAALADVARLEETPGPFHLGFVLGPRVNAGGRIGRADLGAELLSTDMPGRAKELADQLEQLNRDRRELEQQVLEEARQQVAATPPADGLVVAAGHGWHPGVIGIVASRLMEAYDRPSLVIALDDQGQGKGSGRSVRGVDLGGSVIAARQAGYLSAGGGHPMAAGLTVEAGKLNEARAFLEERLGRALAASGYVPALGFDGAVQPGGATLDLLRQLDKLGPYGTGNAEPRFAVPNVRIHGAQVVGENHVRCYLEGADGQRLKAIAFRARDTDLGRALLDDRGVRLHIGGKLRVDQWGARERVQLIIDDAAHASG